MKKLYGDDCAREQTPREPTRKELSEMGELRSQQRLEDKERQKV
jgi:hypothetical protein